MIERGGNKYRLEICPENKRDESTLIVNTKTCSNRFRNSD